MSDSTVLAFPGQTYYKDTSFYYICAELYSVVSWRTEFNSLYNWVCYVVWGEQERKLSRLEAIVIAGLQESLLL